MVMEELQAPGFRFYPTEEELLKFYLHKQLHGKRPQDLHRVIPVVNIYELDPWHLPKMSGELCHEDPEQWFFFAPRQEREASGGRPNRITSSGYWKATGSPSYVYSSDSHVIGLKKTMVFYKGKAPTGRKTKWKMNEYRAIEGETSTTGQLRHEFSLCRIYITTGFLRSFDRRPPAAMTNERPIHQMSTVIATSHKSSNEAEKASSPDCSSLGDSAQNPSMAEAAGDLEIDNDPCPLLELEQLNWFLDDQNGIDPVDEL